MRSQKVFVFDLDGTLYRGNEPISGAVEVVNQLSDLQKTIVYLTNNSSKTVSEYEIKLVEMGFPVVREHIISSATATGQYLKENGFGSAFVVGETGLEQTLNGYGINTSSPLPDAVVAGICRTRLSYEILDTALQHIRRGATFIATNRDATYPLEGDRLSPGAGAIVAAIATCSGIEPVTTGKPNPYILTSWLDQNGFSVQDCLVIGDRVDTDIECAIRANATPILVLSGVTKDAIPGIETVSSVADLL